MSKKTVMIVTTVVGASVIGVLCLFLLMSKYKNNNSDKKDEKNIPETTVKTSPEAEGAKYSVPGSYKYFVCYDTELDDNDLINIDFHMDYYDMPSDGLEFNYLFHPSKKEYCSKEILELPTYSREEKVELVNLWYFNTDYLSGVDTNVESTKNRYPFIPYRENGVLYIYDISKDLFAKVEVDKDIYYGDSLIYHGDSVLDGIIFRSKKDYGYYYYSFIDNKIKFIGSYMVNLGYNYLYIENDNAYWVVKIDTNEIVYSGTLGKENDDEDDASKAIIKDLFLQIRADEHLTGEKVLDLDKEQIPYFNSSINTVKLYGDREKEEDFEYTDLVTTYYYISDENEYYAFGQYGEGFDLRLMYLFINGKDVSNHLTDDNIIEIKQYNDIIVLEGDSESTCGFDPGTIYVFNTKGDLLINTASVNMLTYNEDGKGYENPFLLHDKTYSYDSLANTLTISYSYHFDDYEDDGYLWNSYNTCGDPEDYGISNKQFCKKIKAGKAYINLDIVYTIKNGKIINKKIIPGKKVTNDKSFKEFCN